MLRNTIIDIVIILGYDSILQSELEKIVFVNKGNQSSFIASQKSAKKRNSKL